MWFDDPVFQACLQTSECGPLLQHVFDLLLIHVHIHVTVYVYIVLATNFSFRCTENCSSFQSKLPKLLLTCTCMWFMLFKLALHKDLKCCNYNTFSYVPVLALHVSWVCSWVFSLHQCFSQVILLFFHPQINSQHAINSTSALLYIFTLWNEFLNLFALHIHVLCLYRSKILLVELVEEGVTSLILGVTSLILGVTSLILGVISLILGVTSLILGVTSLILGVSVCRDYFSCKGQD